MKYTVVNTAGEAVSETELPDSIFGLEVSDHVLHHLIKAHRANKRQGTHATKTRAFVSGGGKKPFKQKGTGGARQGSRRAPNIRGGAICHGPQPRDYSLKTNRKTRTLGMKMVLSDKVKNGNLVVLKEFGISQYSTSKVDQICQKLKMTSAFMVDESTTDFLYKSVRNMKSVGSNSPLDCGLEDILRYKVLCISEKGLEALIKRVGV